MIATFSAATEATCGKALWRPPMTAVPNCNVLSVTSRYRDRRTAKRGSGLNRCPFVELINASRFLELLDQLHVPEPPEVVVEAARIVVSITFLEAERFRWIRAQHVVATHSKGGVVQQCLPAGHGGCRRFNYLLA